MTVPIFFLNDLVVQGARPMMITGAISIRSAGGRRLFARAPGRQTRRRPRKLIFEGGRCNRPPVVEPSVPSAADSVTPV